MGCNRILKTRVLALGAAFTVFCICLTIQTAAAQRVFRDVPTPSQIQEYYPVGTIFEFINNDRRTNNITLTDIPACNRPDMTCTPLTAQQLAAAGFSGSNWPRAVVECKPTGEWEIVRSSGACFLPPFGCCYRNIQGNQYVDHGCRIITVSTDIRLTTDNSRLRQFNCAGIENVRDPNGKNYCVFDYINPNDPSVHGDTGDDMFAIKPTAGAFFVNKNVSTDAIYIGRNSTSNMDMMMPSGPPGTYTDYLQFIQNPPEDVTVSGADDNFSLEAGCPPFEINLCGSLFSSLPTPPRVDATCGLAHGSVGYIGMREIPRDALCAFGDYVNVADTSNELRWLCITPPELGGGADAQCSAGRATDGECGGAATGSYTDLAEIVQADFCARGTIVANKAQTHNKITWDCEGLNNGLDKACSVLKSIGGTCGPATGNTYARQRDIQTADYCDTGSPGRIRERSSTITWNCRGAGGGPTVPCVADRSVDGQCGRASGRSYRGLGNIRSRDFCRKGNSANKQENASNITWDCQGLNTGANASCSANLSP